MTKAVYLDADTVNGVYRVVHDDHHGGRVVCNMDFYTCLSEPFTGTLYGIITENWIVNMIQDEYGVNNNV